MLPTPFLPAAVAHRRPTALGVLSAVLLPPLVHVARAMVRPATSPARARTAGTIAVAAPRCLR